jgi:hypothetical protein
MKTIIDNTIVVNLKPEIVKNDEEGIMGGSFKWGLFGKPEVVVNNDEGLVVFCPKKEDMVKNSLKDVHAMRLFCLHIVQQMIKKTEKIDQDFYTKINFELPDDVRESVTKVLSELEVKVLEEIFYQNNPIKPLKNEIKKISL